MWHRRVPAKADGPKASKRLNTYVLRVDFDGQQKFRVVDFLLDTFNDLEQNTGSVLETSAIFIGSLVHSWRDELR